MGSPPTTRLGADVLIVITIFLVGATVAVGLRLWSINIIQRPYRTHDYLIFLALLISCGHIAIIYLAVLVGGLGTHITEVSPTALSALLKLFVADNFSWLFSTTAVKTSVLFLYLDIFKIQTSFRRVLYGFIVFIALFFIGFLVSIVTLCQPFSRYWNVLGPGHCGSLSGSQVATSSINTIVDLAIVLLPVPIIWKLQMQTQKKIKIIAIFAVGAIICLINVARLVTAVALDQEDFSYSLSAGAILTALEVEIGIINACLPTINPIFTHYNKGATKGSKLRPIGTSWDHNPPGSSRKPLTFGHIYNSGGGSNTAAYTTHSNTSFPSNASHEAIKVTRDLTIHTEEGRV